MNSVSTYTMHDLYVEIVALEDKLYGWACFIAGSLLDIAFCEKAARTVSHYEKAI